MENIAAPQNIRIIVADDHQMIRSGLRALLQTKPGFEVVGEADNGRSAVRLAAELTPDVILMDVIMPDLNGIEATRQIKASRERTRIIALSAHSDRRLTLEMLKAGACGFVVKDAAVDDLLNAVRSAVAEKVYLSPNIAHGVANDLDGQHRTRSVLHQLSPREREILQLIAEGMATKEIAMHLHLSVKTVETHRRKVMDKLQIYSVAELTKYAIREGISTLQ